MNQPTQVELEILKILWKHAPRTARELHDGIAATYEWSYSSTRKTLERMGDKKMVSWETRGNKKLYYAELKKMETLAALAKDFANRVFEIKGSLPVAMFAQSELMNEDEIAELEKVLESGKDTEEQERGK